MQNNIKEWIEYERSTYFIDFKETIEDYGHRSVTKYGNKLVNNNNNNNHMCFNHNVFCYKSFIWELSSNEIYFNFDNIIINFEIYNYLIKNINKHVDKLNDMPFLNSTVSNKFV